MNEDPFNELWNLAWVGIPDFPYVLKYRFDEEGYVLMVSDLAAVFGEKLDEKAIQERFQILNPYAEMLPKVILKHVKQSITNIVAGEQASKETQLNITLEPSKVTIQYQFNVSGVGFIFNFEPLMLSDNQFKTHVLRPVLVRALILDEEKSILQRKLEELEGKQNSPSSNRSSEKRNIKAIYSNIKGNDSPVSGVVQAFLYMQKDKIIVPESLEGTPNVSPLKRSHSSSKSVSMLNRKKDSKSTTKNIPYKEDDSDERFESQNAVQQAEVPKIFIKLAKTEEDNADINEFDNSINNIPPKKEETPPKPTPYLKLSPSKKKKLLKF